MRGNYNQFPQQVLRNSYGFQPTPLHKISQPQNPPYYHPPHTYGQEDAHKNIQSKIKNLQSKIQGIESLAKKKSLNHQKAFNQIPHKKNITNQSDQKKSYVGLPTQMKGMDLRGSCPNIYKREQLRNTVNIGHKSPIQDYLNHEASSKKPSHRQIENISNNNPSFIKQQQSKRKMQHSPRPASPHISNFTSLNQILANKQQIKKNQLINKNKIVQGFQLGRNLGKGKFGEVYLAKHLATGFVVALKKIVKQKVKEYKMVQQLKNQIKLHSSLNHPNIVKFFGLIEQPNQLYLVMEYMNGGTLFDYLNEKDSLTVRETVDFLRDIISALTYLHDRSIAHRDIKPQNIVLSSQGVAKLCDFGWSAFMENSRKTYCGTFDYAPPQILERKNYDSSVDIWCIGVLTYELLTGKVPFEGEKRNIIMNKIINVDKNKIDYPTEIPQEARNFIESLVRKNPDQRPKSKDLLKHMFFINNPSLTKSKKPE